MGKNSRPNAGKIATLSRGSDATIQVCHAVHHYRKRSPRDPGSIVRRACNRRPWHLSLLLGRCMHAAPHGPPADRRGVPADRTTAAAARSLDPGARGARCAGRAQIAAIVAYYDPTTRSGAARSAVRRVALGAEKLSTSSRSRCSPKSAWSQPGELSEGERARFLGDRLTRCTIRVDIAAHRRRCARPSSCAGFEARAHRRHSHRRHRSRAGPAQPRGDTLRST